MRAVDPCLDVEVVGTEQEWTASVVRRDTPAPEAEEVTITRISTGASPACAACIAAANLKLCAGKTRSSWSAVVMRVGG